MSGGIEECDVLTVDVYLISTDMLCDAACLACGNMSISDAVEDRGLTVVNVTHNDYNRAAGLEICIVIVGIVDKTLLNGNDNFLLYLCAHFLSYERSCIEVDLLIDGSHYTQLHQLLDDFCSSSLQTGSQLADCDGIGDEHLQLLLSCSLQLQSLELLSLRLLLGELLAVPLSGLLIDLLLL